MKILIQNKLFISLVFFSLAFTACKSSKTLETGSLAGMGNAEFFNSALHQSPAYQSLSGKLNLAFSTPQKSLSSNATIKIIKNQHIQLSFQPFLGLEVARVDISPDSILFVDRINKKYLAESLSQLLKSQQISVDFNFSNLQAILSNQIFIAGEDSISLQQRNLFTIHIKDQYGLLSYQDFQLINYEFTCDYQARLVQLAMSENQSKQKLSLQVEYDNFQPLNLGTSFPMQHQLSLRAKQVEKYQLKLQYSKVELDKEFALQFSVPTKYRRVKAKDLLKMINNLW